MNRKRFIVIGTILCIIGMIVMIAFNDTDYGDFIGGLFIGAGIGYLSVLFSPKTDKLKN